MSDEKDALEREYEELLRMHGVEHLLAPTTPEDRAAALRGLREEAAYTAEILGGENLVEAELERMRKAGVPLDGSRGNHHADIGRRVAEAARDAGLTLPGRAYVGEFPTYSFNAQAMRARTAQGALLLVNTGLTWLLTEVSRALHTGVLIVSGEDDGRYRLQEPTSGMSRLRDEATATLARSLAGYILQELGHVRGGRTGRQRFLGDARGVQSHLVARAAHAFVVAHEFGHFLDGHLDAARPRDRRSPPDGEYLRKSHEQELAADQIGAMLTLQIAPQLFGGLSFSKEMAVCGIFLFLGIDHLLNRVAGEVTEVPAESVVSDHPPSDSRAAALRVLITDLEGLDVWSLPDALLHLLAYNEDAVVAEVRRLFREDPPPDPY